MNYFLSGALGGRPTGLASLNKSTTDGAYMFVLPTLRTGSMPLRRIRVFTDSKLISRISAISSTVSSFIASISVQLLKHFNALPGILLMILSKLLIVLAKMTQIRQFTIRLYSKTRKYFKNKTGNGLIYLTNRTDYGLI